MPWSPARLPHLIALATAALLTACGGGGGGDTATTAGAQDGTNADMAAQGTRTPPTRTPTQADRVAVGSQLFHDPALSASGRQACDSCHAPDRGHADPAGTFLPLGGLGLDRQGLRSSPSLNYLNGTPAFRVTGPGQALGGFTWDGRADDRAAQARGPLFSADEMAHTSEAVLAAQVRQLAYYADLRFAYGLAANASDTQVIDATLRALADYQAGDTDYQPFSSKFDAVQAGRASFTAAEQRGLAAFNDPRRGNCASCHTSTAPAGQAPVFTNFQYFALGAPRNQSTATADPTFFDLGLCGPKRTDLAGRSDLCGLFKVPTLRNVALTAPYFHNGVFQTLEQVLAFYATRDTDPARWYPPVNGQPQRFNDLPAAYHGNVTQRPPFGRGPGQAPALTLQDQADIVAFLRTLTDGFTP